MEVESSLTIELAPLHVVTTVNVNGNDEDGEMEFNDESGNHQVGVIHFIFRQLFV